MPPSVTITFRSGSTPCSRARSPRAAPAAPRVGAYGGTLGGARAPPRRRAAACRPPDGRRPRAGSASARRARATASSSTSEQPPQQRDVDLRRAHELVDRHVLDVGVRARADRAVVDGRDARRPRRARRRRRPSCRPARALLPVTSRYDACERAQRARARGRSRTRRGRAAGRARSSQPVSAATRASSARYSASTASSVLPGAQRRVPTMRHVVGKRL